MLTLRDYQAEAIAAVNKHLSEKDNNPCVVLPTGCHAEGHPILMFDGTVKHVEDVAVGDEVMGPDSKPRKVICLHRGRDDMYKITPVKGEPFVVNSHHILSLVCTNENKPYPCAKKGGEIENVDLSEYLSKPKSWKHIRKLRRVSVDFCEDVALPIKPYILGLLLGDGTMLNNTVGLTTADREIAEEFATYIAFHGGCVSLKSNGSKALTYIAEFLDRNGNWLNSMIRGLGLMGHKSDSKFIPHEYLVASRKDRLELLAGLVDTDGYVEHGIDYVTDSDRLAHDIVFLSRSLGFAAYSTYKVSACQTGAVGIYTRIHISGDLSVVPCRRIAHKNKIHVRRQKKDVLRTGFSVESVGTGNYYGFTLDGDHLYVDGNFTVHHNSGKSFVMAEMLHQWIAGYPQFRCVVLAHRKELVDQNSKEFIGLLGPHERALCGVYSAGLGEKNMNAQITFAAIDSIYNKCGSFLPFDAILVDEAHRIPVRGEGKYRVFINGCRSLNPNVRVIGLTATPYRLGSGPICHKDYILNEVCYEANVGDLIAQGYLCNLRSKVSDRAPDLSGVKKSCGDYQQKALGAVVRNEVLVESAVTDALAHLNEEKRTSCVWFCVDVDHCTQVLNALSFRGERAVAVTGETSAHERDAAVEAFRNRQYRHILNVNVFTEGFNVKQVDAVILLRPTLSKGLYYQMVGRGLRLHPDKTDCLVLDYAHCIETHGPIDALESGSVRVEVCQRCREVFARGVRICPKCGWEIPKQVIEEREKVEAERRMHEARAAQLAILGSTPTEYEVDSATVTRHSKNGVDSLCVSYRCGISMFREWICLDHTGFAREKAERWWRARFGEKSVVPSVDEALADMFLGYSIAQLTAAVTVVKRGKYNEIIYHRLKEIQK